MNRGLPINWRQRLPPRCGSLMIGVIAPREQTGAVEEFFQLFKTPWEFYREDRTYDVLISTTREVVGANARLLLFMGLTSTASMLR